MTWTVKLQCKSMYSFIFSISHSYRERHTVNGQWFRYQLCTFPWESSFSWNSPLCDATKDKGSPLIMQTDGNGNGRFAWIVYKLCAFRLNSTNQHVMELLWFICCFRFTLIGMNRGVCHQGEPDVYTNLLLPEVSNWIRKVAKSSDEKSICSTYEESISHPSLELTVSQAYSFFAN